MTGENIGIYGSTLYSDGLLALDAKNSLEIGTIENTTHLDYSMTQKIN